MPFIGCYYSYNDVEVGESIIDTSGIQMTKVSYCMAHVKWGADKGYFEPVVMPEDEPLNVTEVDALDVVPFDGDSSNNSVYRACSAVKVLISM